MQLLLGAHVPRLELLKGPENDGHAGVLLHEGQVQLSLQRVRS